MDGWAHGHNDTVMKINTSVVMAHKNQYQEKQHYFQLI
jgi:hypothetical protein